MNRPTPELIQEALLTRRPMRIRYHSRTGSGVTTRDVYNPEERKPPPLGVGIKRAY